MSLKRGAKVYLVHRCSHKVFPASHTDMTAGAGIDPAGDPSKKPTDPLSRSAPNGRLGGPRDIAGAALLLASPAGTNLTGVTITTDGGFSLSPVQSLPKELRELYEPPPRAKL